MVHISLFCLGETPRGLLRQKMIKIFSQEEVLCYCSLLFFLLASMPAVFFMLWTKDEMLTFSDTKEWKEYSKDKGRNERKR